MKYSKVITLTVMAAAVVFASCASAYAAGSGTVYGEATMQPTVSLVLSGAGSDLGSPLVYQGHAGQNVFSMGMAQVTVANDGQVDVPILLGFGSNPTDGNDTWNIASAASTTDCRWEFQGAGWANVPSASDAPVELWPGLIPGASTSLANCFTFPSTYDGSVHTMTALIIAGDPVDSQTPIIPANQ